MVVLKQRLRSVPPLVRFPTVKVRLLVCTPLVLDDWLGNFHDGGLVRYGKKLERGPLCNPSARSRRGRSGRIGKMLAEGFVDLLAVVSRARRLRLETSRKNVSESARIRRDLLPSWRGRENEY
jgi:hypothetical protein